MAHETGRYRKPLRFGGGISSIGTTVLVILLWTSSFCAEGAFLSRAETPIVPRTRLHVANAANSAHFACTAITMSISPTSTGEGDAVRGTAAGTASTGYDCPETRRREGLRLVVSDFHSESSAESLPPSVWTDCGDALLRFLLDHHESRRCDEGEGVALLVADRASEVSEQFLRISASSAGKLETRQALQRASRGLLLVGNKRRREPEPEPERDRQQGQSQRQIPLPAAAVLSVSSVMAALALGGGEEHGGEGGDVDGVDRRAWSRAAASAIASTVSDRHGRLDGYNDDQDAAAVVANGMVRALLVLAGGSSIADKGEDGDGCDVDLHIVASLARALGVGGSGDGAPYEVPVSDAAASVIRQMLMRLDSPDIVVNGSGGGGDRPAKAQVAAALALAAQLGPWGRDLSPVRAIDAAVSYDLWHAAERVCHSAVATAAGRLMGDGGSSRSDPTVSIDDGDGEELARAAVHALIDAAFEAKSYRRADAFATEFYSTGGRSRFVEARFCHACSTIAKLLKKGAVQVIEVQVDRVDRAAARVAADGGGEVEENTGAENNASPSESSPGEKIRTFALRQLEEAGDFTSAHRLAGLWGMDYVYDERVLAAAVSARRRKYLQWDDVVPGVSVPHVASTPEALRRAFASERGGRFGFDVEWGSDHGGAALLQIASADGWAVLVDVPALSGTADGVDALRGTAGRLFASSSRHLMIGFGCRQDLARLRSSPCVGDGHWLEGGTSAVVELRHLVAGADPELRGLGLSRVCARYVGKPLDKSEQCSLWTARPLSAEQRVYAALDAWVCAAIHERLLPSWAPAKSRAS